MDPARVLSELSELIVRRVADRDDEATDPFARAAMRVMEGGEPAPESGWRGALRGVDAHSHHAAIVLKRLTRDLLHGITSEPAPDPEGTPTVPLPENVRPISEALQPAPGFERADDGRWKPAAPAEEDLLRGHGPRSPRLPSRYPSG